MNAEAPVVAPLPSFKPKWSVVVDDPLHKDHGKVGIVVATATTVELALVSVKFKLDQSAIWFFSDQLKRA